MVVPLGTPHENPVVLSQNDWRTIGEEGWRNDRIRGVWSVRVEHEGRFGVRLRWRKDLPVGTAYVALGDSIWSVRVATGATQTDLDPLILAEGSAQLEAWLETDQTCPTARHGRFIPALYVEVERIE